MDVWCCFAPGYFTYAGVPRAHPAAPTRRKSLGARLQADQQEADAPEGAGHAKEDVPETEASNNCPTWG